MTLSPLAMNFSTIPVRALIDGTLSMVISHPMEKLAYETIATLVKAKGGGPDAGARWVAFSFDIYTSEGV